MPASTPRALPVALGALALVFAASAARAAPAGTVQVTGPSTLTPSSEVTYGVAYTLTGSGVSNARVAVALPLGFDVQTALGPQGVSTTCTGNPVVGVTCTFGLAFSSGGVAGQLTLAGRLRPGVLLDGAVATTTATLRADYDEGAGVAPMNPVSGSHQAVVEADAVPSVQTWAISEVDWRVNPSPPPGKSAVGLSWVYRVRARSFGANLNAGWTLAITPPAASAIVSADIMFEGSVASPPAWTVGGTVTATGSAPLAEGFVDASVRVWVSCSDLPSGASSLVNATQVSGFEAKTSGDAPRTASHAYDVAPDAVGAACGAGGGASKSSSPQNSIGEGETFAWTVSATAPNGVVAVTDAVVVDRIPAGLRFVSASQAAPAAFSIYYCQLPGETGNFTRAQFLATYRTAGCSTAPPANAASVTHVVWHAAAWGDPSSGISPFSATLTVEAPLGVFSHEEVVTNTALVSGGFNLGTPATFAFSPSDGITILTTASAETGIGQYPGYYVVRRPGEPFDILAAIGSQWGLARIRNPVITLRIPAEMELVEAAPLQFGASGCPYGEPGPPVHSATPELVTEAGGVTAMTWRLGTPAAPTRMGFDCLRGAGGWTFNRPVWVKITVRIRPDAPVVNGQQLNYASSVTGDNVPFPSPGGMYLAVARPAEMQTDVQPDCTDAATPEPSLLVTYRNTGGEDLTGLIVSARVPKVGDGSGTQVDTTFVRVENVPAGLPVEYEVSGSWTAALPANLALVTAVRVLHPSPLAPLTPQRSFNIVLAVPAGTPTGTFIRGSSLMSASPLGNLASANSSPIKVNLCPGVLAVHAFFDADADGEPDADEVDLSGWTVKVADALEPASELVWTTDSEGGHAQQIAPGDYLLTLVPPAPAAGATWGPMTYTATVASNQTVVVLMPVRCSCAPQGPCIDGTCSPSGTCSYAPAPSRRGVVDVCDGEDDDCDGRVDEDFSAETETCGVGACARTGETSCLGGAIVSGCTPGAPGSELCDGVDNDCDGLTDANDPSLARPACERQAGVCAGAVKSAALCVAGAQGASWAPCQDADYAAWAFSSTEDAAGASGSYAAAEAAGCDGLDNDCDGATDEGFVPDAVMCGLGVCQRSAETACVGGVETDMCEPDTEKASAEVCDGVDNDCDGRIDQLADGGSVCLELETIIEACPDSPTALTAWLFRFRELNDGAVAFECRLDGGAWTRCDSGSLQVEGLSQGSHTLLVRALGGELQGRFDTTPAFCVWTVDTTAPDTFILSAPEDPSQTGDAVLVFGSNVTNPDGYFCFTAPGPAPLEPPPLAAYAPCDVVETVTGLPDGLHTVHVYVVSAAGVRDESPAVYTWLIDSTAPATAVTARPDPVVCGTTVTVGYEDPSDDTVLNFECRLDDEAWEACPAPSRTWDDLEPGNHIIDIRAVDAAGLADPTPARVAFTVDVTAPVVTVTLGPDSPSQNPAAAFAFQSDDFDTSFRCAVTPAGETPTEDQLRGCAAPFTVTGLADGAWTFHVKALGRWCGEGELATWRWVIDTTYPETAFLTTPDVLVGAGQGTIFTYHDPTDEAATTFECSLDGGEWVACDGGELSVPGLPLGPHQLAVRTCAIVRDGESAERRCDPTPATTAWFVSPSACPLDRDPPAIACPEPTVLACVDGGATFDATRLEVSATDDCGAVTAFEGAIGGFYPLGLSPVVVSASDDNGNISTCAALVEVVDTAPPTIECPEEIRATTDPGSCGVRVDLGDVVARDACAGTAVNVRNNAPPVFGPGETEVTFTALDPAGYEATCTTRVTVTDEEALTLTCERELTRVAPADACGWSGGLTAEASDNCAVDVTIVEERNTFAVGTQQVAFSAQDSDGNAATCVTVLTVKDETAPTVSCGDLGGEAAATGPVAIRAGASDACGATVTLEDVTCSVIGLDGVVRPLPSDRCPLRVSGDLLEVTGLLPDGALVVDWTARAVDPSGNVATAPCSLNFASDLDRDGLLDAADNCPLTANADQRDMDADGNGDACDDRLDGIVATGSGCSGGADGGAALVLGLLAALALCRRRVAGPA
jgi:uncharacterized repeat protein (TIGR01451 family)